MLLALRSSRSVLRAVLSTPVLAIMLGIAMIGTHATVYAQSDDALGHGYSRPARSPHGSRSEVIAPHGMVAASQPLAAQVGLDILKAGGNAVDAAVAVNAVLGLVEPHMNGVGGDLYALVWDAETEQLYGLNATGARALRDQPRDPRPPGLHPACRGTDR